MFLRGLNGLVVSVHFGLKQEHALNSILHMSSFRVILTYLSANKYNTDIRIYMHTYKTSRDHIGTP